MAWQEGEGEEQRMAENGKALKQHARKPSTSVFAVFLPADVDVCAGFNHIPDDLGAALHQMLHIDLVLLCVEVGRLQRNVRGVSKGSKRWHGMPLTCKHANTQIHEHTNPVFSNTLLS